MNTYTLRTYRKYPYMLIDKRISLSREEIEEELHIKIDEEVICTCVRSECLLFYIVKH